MEKGRIFSSFDEFELYLAEYNKENFTLFVKRSSEAMKDTNLVHLKYETVSYVCKHGQSKHTGSSTGQRPGQRSMKLGCPAKLRLKVKRPPDVPPHLAITVSELEHRGHDVTKEAYAMLPENRRVALNEATKLVACCSTIKSSELKKILEKEHGVCLKRQDVYNLKRRASGGVSDSEECERRTNEIMKNGGVVHAGSSESGELSMWFFMTVNMIQMLCLFPEVIVLDVTYNTNVYLYPLLTAMVIDGHGHGIPVMHAFLRREDMGSMVECLKLFAQQYTSSLTKCFVVDKEFAEFSAIEALYPDIPINLCCFHVNRAVKQYLKKELSPESVESVLDSFMSQVYTESEEEFASLTRQISDIVPQSVCTYLKVNWWDKMHLWAACRNIYVVELHATTTNHLENYHSKIKKILNEKLSLSSAFGELVSFDNTKISECQRQHLIQVNSLSYDYRDTDDVFKAMTRCMTKFAAEMSKTQLICARKTKYDFFDQGDSFFSVSYREKSYTTAAESCSCSFFQHMSLPCRHIFALRAYLQINIFEEVLVNGRYRLFSRADVSSITTSLNSKSSLSTPAMSYRTQKERSRKAKSVCDFIVRHLTVLGEEEFREKLARIESVIESWSNPDTVPSRHKSSPISKISADPVVSQIKRVKKQTNQPNKQIKKDPTKKT